LAHADDFLAAFRGKLSEEQRAPLEAVLERALRQGATEHPDARLPAEDFVRHLAAKLPASEDPVGALSALISSDLYLALAASRGDGAALRSFEALLQQTAKAVQRLDPSAQLLDEVIQAVRAELLVSRGGSEPKLMSYGGRGSLASWLRTVAVVTAAGILRKRSPERSASEQTWSGMAAGAGASAELAFFKSEYREHFQAVFRESLSSLSVRERNVLRMRFMEGLTTDEIGGFYNVHRTSVARWIEKATETLLARIREGLMARLGVTRSEIDSLMRLFTSELELSLAAFLEPDERS
jgi:RNA polymerase sigma-70 factor (ECF subfamily)